MKTAPLWLACLTLLSAWHAGAAAEPARPEDSSKVDEMVRDVSVYAPPARQSRSLWVELDARSDLFLSGAGGELGIGYLFRYFGVDARVAYGKAEHGALAVDPGASQLGFATAAASDPSSELNRPRDNHDPWLYALVEPGISVSGRIFPRALPRLWQRARAGFGYGTFSDVNNSVTFTALLFTVEASALWQLGEQSPWSVGVSLGWSTGNLHARLDPSTDASMGQLPLSWVTDSIGLVYSF